MDNVCDRVYWLISHGKGRGKVFVVLYPYEEEVWVDVKALPQTCFLCACCDGISILQVKCSKNITRNFLPLEWLINDWGATDEFVIPLNQLKEKMKMEAKRIREELNENSGNTTKQT